VTSETPEKKLDAWPESKEELLGLILSFHRLQKRHVKHYTLSLAIFGVPTGQAEIAAVFDAGDQLAAATELLSQKLDFWC